jgi:phosphatidylethanolamine-binding protein (PEBP) family uncharacterized protein
MTSQASRATKRLAIRELDGADRSISIASASFESDRPIPMSHSAYGEGRSPELHWGHVPHRTQTLVLLVEDPDAPQAKPFVHWSRVCSKRLSTGRLPMIQASKFNLRSFERAPPACR